ncbi:hypothetical protein KP509_29G037400 [Ceratopteris richardii]|uniref:C2H2-type domain-containing protein n=1 Tax=Ceratopteris richardii TaxID=49495 RepID=A0A8T2R7U1_CERRI|nr:hypothetical protein KP509_29G037400 [Ceratopteris richardii]
MVADMLLFGSDHTDEQFYTTSELGHHHQLPWNFDARMDRQAKADNGGRWNSISSPDNSSISWETRAFAEDASSLAAGIWPPRAYPCSFCRREFRSAQALGGHMNVHRRDRARLRHSSPPSPLPPRFCGGLSAPQVTALIRSQKYSDCPNMNNPNVSHIQKDTPANHRSFATVVSPYIEAMPFASGDGSEGESSARSFIDKLATDAAVSLNKSKLGSHPGDEFRLSASNTISEKSPWNRKLSISSNIEGTRTEARSHASLLTPVSSLPTLNQSSSTGTANYRREAPTIQAEDNNPSKKSQRDYSRRRESLETLRFQCSSTQTPQRQNDHSRLFGVHSDQTMKSKQKTLANCGVVDLELRLGRKPL